jgi:GMP synthase PP-ATPase subunit
MHTLHQQGGALQAVESDYQRQDERRRDIVNHGISVQESRNTMSAIEYLKSHDIAPDVIERVLLEPHRRRSQPHH